MAVTADGIPIRCWTFAGNQGDQAIIRTVKDDLGCWNLRRLVFWVADRGFASIANRAYLTQGRRALHPRRETQAHQHRGSCRAGPPRPVAGNLRVKEVHVNPNDPAGGGDGDGGARAVRFVVCHNSDKASVTSRSAPTWWLT